MLSTTLSTTDSVQVRNTQGTPDDPTDDTFTQEVRTNEQSIQPGDGGFGFIVDQIAFKKMGLFTPYATGLPHMRSGRLRPLGVSTLKRLPDLPDIPAIAETLPGYEVLAWNGLVVPARTPAPIVKRLADEIRKATQQPDVQQKVAAMGFELKDSSPEAFAAEYKKERPGWERLIKQSGAKLE